MFGWCVCVYMCIFCYAFEKTVLEEKKLDVHVKFYFVFFACFYISKKYITVSVIQVESIQGDLTESRSLN